MNAMLLAAYSLLVAASGVSGQVVDAGGAPLPNARAFMEPGIGGSLIEAEVDGDGRFRFPEVPIGPVGFFAHAPGHAFGGRHLNVSVGDSPANLRIVLRNPGTVSGTVKNSNGDRVEDARVTRLALLDDKVGIPLAKLKPFGFVEPASDRRGAFEVRDLPAGTGVALKVGHPDYAQEGVDDVRVGGRVDITLYRGVLIDGSVIQTSTQHSVGQAAVLIRSAQPPYDTAIVQTDTFGAFALRLKPGVYLAQALSVGQASPGWQELVVTGETNLVRCRLSLVGTGVITGKLMDAASGNPIEGARITLETNGNMAAVERTGPTGEFRFVAGQGRNVVAYAATPGFLPPETRDVALDLEGGQTINLPDMWLAPLPPFHIQVLDGDMEPVPHARVQMLRPRQFGWQSADAQGKLQISLRNLGGDGSVVGMAEDPKRGQAALFQLERNTGTDARVQVLPLGSLEGRVVAARNRPLPGVMVGAIFPGEDVTGSLLLWRVMTDREGRFSWPALVPDVPQICVARGQDDAQTASKNVQAGLDVPRALDIGDLQLPNASPGESIVGEKLDWASDGRLCGAPLADGQEILPKVLLYVSPAQLDYVLETLQKDTKLYAEFGWMVVVLTPDSANCADSGIPVFKGRAPTGAQTYILGGDNTVLMETFDVPPFSLLNAVRER